MKNSLEYLKKGALVIVIASMSQSSAIASPLEKTTKTNEESQASLQNESLDITDAEHKKLSKGQVVIGTRARPNGRRWVTAKIKINAHPSVVWETIHEERKTDPDLAYSKVVEENKNELTLEQKFQLLPVIGTSVCLIKSNEIPHKRIDYYLLKSDRFKAVEGSWILEPQEDGSTILELGSFIDIGVPAPRTFVEGIAGKKLERRVSNVKKVAENHKAIAQNAPKTEAHSTHQ